MKIVDVKSYTMSTAWRNLTFVRVLTDAGIEGVAEVRMLNHTDALLGYLEEAVPNMVLGHDPQNIESLVQTMYRHPYARMGEIAMSGIAMIEIACWDILGKMLNQPVYKLLGGAVREQIGIRQRLVHGGTLAPGVSRCGEARDGAWIPGTEVRPVRRGFLRDGASGEARGDSAR